MERKTLIRRGAFCPNKLCSLLSTYVYALFFLRSRGESTKKLNNVGQRIFLQNDRHKKKYRLVKWNIKKYKLVKWNIMRQPKQQGGLGIQDLDIQNKYLLRKWLYKLCNEEGLWQEILRNKYLKNCTLSQISKKAGDSYFCSSLMR